MAGSYDQMGSNVFASYNFNVATHSTIVVSSGPYEFLQVKLSASECESYRRLMKTFNELIFKEMKSIDVRCWVAGGSIRDFFTKNHVPAETDIDVYFSSQNHFEAAKRWYLDKDYCPIDTMVRRLNITNEVEKTELMRRTVNRQIGTIDYETDNAIRINIDDRKIDLVKNLKQDPLKTLEYFDMTVTQAAIENETLYHSVSYFADLLTKSIVLTNVHHPLSTLQRIPKYISKGFFISHAEMMKIAKAIKQIPINEINPIEFGLDQLENPNGVKETKYVVQQERTPIAGTSGNSKKAVSYDGY